jgi:2-desacetyl-2-hydroxyethyl bacteriochlorophyllide A dehydrogenase
MRVATWEAIESVQLSEVAELAVEANDVVIDVAACGICGSDVHSYVEGAWIAPGMAMGHEFSGTVSEIGREVTGIQLGDRVAVNPVVSCGTCARCASGHRNLCSSMSGSSGGFADRVKISGARLDEQLFRLPESLSMQAAAFLEPLSVATRAVATATPNLDEPILLIGLGTIGQCVLQVLKAYGASDIIAVDGSPLRRAAAAQAGAHEVLDPFEVDVLESVLASRGTINSPYQVSGSVGAVFECSGAVAALPGALQLARAAAPISLIALASKDIELDINMVVQKELKLLGSFAYTPADCQEAFRLLASGAAQVDALVSHVFPLSEIGAAFEAQRDPSSSIKVMVIPN